MINLGLIETLNNESEDSPINRQINCFGAAALYLGFVTTNQWMDYRTIQSMMEENMEEIQETELKENDLYALYDQIGILHTAIYLGDSFWQKPGKWKAEFTSKKSIDTAHILDSGRIMKGCYTKCYRIKNRRKELN